VFIVARVAFSHTETLIQIHPLGPIRKQYAIDFLAIVN